MDFSKVTVRPIAPEEDECYQQLLDRHHYLGAIPKIGQTLRYVAQHGQTWVALLSFSAASLKCAPRDRWIGWDARLQYGRLKLIANNSRFLILPDWHQPNLGSKVLALCQRRVPGDWLERFGHPLLLLETFVDPQRFHGTMYRAANWTCVGLTQGFRRTAGGYSAQAQTPKQVFLRALHPRARQRLAQPILDPRDHTEAHPTMTLTAEQMRALPDSFSSVSDPRRAQGRRHPMRAVLAIAAGATLCGMRGYKAIAQWAQGLGQKGAQRIGCRRDPDTREYLIPSVNVIREVLMRVDPAALDRALGAWNALWAARDRSLAIEGKTLRGAADSKGLQVHVMSAVGHESKAAYTPKKVSRLSADYNDEVKRTNEIKTAAPMLDAIDIAGRVITADALLTQRDLADYVVRRGAHYHFAVKGNQPTLHDDIRRLFAQRAAAHHTEVSPPNHGRIETRRIWCSSRLNDYAAFPHVGQVFLIEREVLEKNSGKRSLEVALGVTSCTPEQASPTTVLRHNRGHWAIENSCHYILDQTWDEDHCRIRTGYGPENTSRLRRFAISVLNLHTKPGDSIASMTRKLASKTRLVFDYLLMTKNSTGHAPAD